MERYKCLALPINYEPYVYEPLNSNSSSSCSTFSTDKNVVNVARGSHQFAGERVDSPVICYIHSLSAKAKKLTQVNQRMTTRIELPVG